MLITLLFFSAGRVTAADGPVIRSPTVVVRSNDAISFQFEASGAQASGFQIQTTAGLGSAAAWEVNPEGTITEVMPGLYQVTVPFRKDGQPSFYRIVVSNAPAAPLFLNEVMSDNTSKIADQDGKFWDWIEIYNPSDSAVDLQGYGLSDDESRLHRWQFPNVLLQPGAFVVVFASGLDRREPGKDLHVDFKLNASGERLFLTAPDRRVLDQVQSPSLTADQSAGRSPEGGEAWHIYSKALATPGAANSVVSLGPLIAPPRFSVGERFFPGGTVVTLKLEPGAPGQTIRYTTDGSPVTSTSTNYDAPIVLEQTTVVRARAFEESRFSAELARTFFIGAEHQLPIISLAAQPSHFEFRNGYLYGMGSSVLSSTGQVLQNFPFSGSNAFKDREIEVSLEFYEPDHRPGFQLHAGLKIYGGWGSRGYPQKSFALFARQKYGEGKINYRVFPDEPIKEFETLVLRNSGNDNQSSQQTAPRPPVNAFGSAPSYGSYFVNGNFTLMRDAMMQELLKETSLDTQAYRPAVVYINGDYWGIYNIREKLNEHYVLGHHGIGKGQIDLIESYGDVRAGDNKVYQAMRDFIATRDLKVATNYATVEEKYLEIDNFIDYHLAVIYFQNFDIGNIKCWRPRTANGRFRWMVYDQDYGFNLWKPEVYLPAMKRDYADYDNMFQFYTAGSGTAAGWPNAGGRTLLLGRLLANDSFKERFIRRCADLLNSTFREERVVRTIQDLAGGIRPEVPRHLQRWSWTQLQQRGFGRPHQSEYEPFTQETWEKNLQVLLDFARKRPAKLRQDCLKHFGLREGLAEVTVKVEPSGAGRVQLNSLALANFPWSGIYFRDYPITATAIPKPGYRFVGWSGAGTTLDQPRWELRFNEATASLTARFEAVQPGNPPTPGVIVTEFQYHPAPDRDSGDWVELHNPGSQPVRITGWILRDDSNDHDFLLPEIELAPGGYVVLCEDTAKFSRVYPNVANRIGDFPFGFGNEGDTIRLFEPAGTLRLSLEYDDRAPWPPEADGTGRTLQLMDRSSYAAKPDAWKPSPEVGGTPGGANP